MLNNRRSIRLPRFDYSSCGAYFVTMCARNRQCLFGNIANGQIVLNKCGEIVSNTWRWLEQQYQYVSLYDWAVMPNHLHGIIMINRVDGDCRCGSQTDDDVTDCRGGSRTAPTEKQKIKPLGRLVGAFKTVSTKHINELRQTPGAIVWQRNYYEHIIRDDNDLNRTREYITNNPARWAEDDDNPENIQNDK